MKGKQSREDAGNSLQTGELSWAGAALCLCQIHLHQNPAGQKAPNAE